MTLIVYGPIHLSPITMNAVQITIDQKTQGL